MAGLEYRHLFDETNLLYCGRGHPFFGRPDVTIADEEVEAAPRIARGYLEGFDSHLFARSGHAATVTETDGAVLLIQTGRYLGFLPEHHAAPWVAKGQMRALRPERYQFATQFHLITRRDARDGTTFDRLATCLGPAGSRTLTTADVT